MPKFSLYHVVAIIAIIATGVFQPASSKRFSTERSICKLLEDKLVSVNSWSDYPIVFEPIRRGRLTIWSGVSTLPSSEFECYAPKNASGSVILNFASFANKLEWTFHDMNRGVTHHGFSVNHQDNVKFRVSLEDNQKHSYLSCNYVKNIEKISLEDLEIPAIHTQCNDCSRAIVSIINGQLEELLRTKFTDQTIDNLSWHLTQLISNQHFSSPLSLI